MYWDLVEAFFRGHSLIEQHIDSFNDFVENKLQEVVDDVGIIEPDVEGYKIKMGEIKVGKPIVVEADGSKRPMYPMEARLRNRSYTGPITLKLAPIESGVEKEMREVHIGDLPIMIRSKLCHLYGAPEEEIIGSGEDGTDPGGYFIINGSEKVIVTIEDLAPNRIFVSKESKGGKTVTVAKVFSTRRGFRAKVTVERGRDGLMYVSFPASPRNLNLIAVLRALGLGLDKEIFSAFAPSGEVDRFVRNDLLINMEAITPKNSDEALDYLGKRVAAGQPEEYRKKRASQILDNYLLPHLGTKDVDRLRKAYYLCRMVQKVTDVASGIRQEDDKDHYANKRLKISGKLMEELFRYSFNYFIKDVKYQVERAYVRGRKLEIRTIVRPNALTDRIRFAMATGTWVGGRTGVSQLLDRTTFLSYQSHLRRVTSPLSKSHPHFEARDLHPTHWGKICPNETPEGQSCGLVKNFSYTTVISNDIDNTKVEETLESLGVTFKKR
jgi:DNA-directed RNA polymerase subunit B"